MPHRVIALLLTGWTLLAVQIGFAPSVGAQEPDPVPPRDPAEVVRDETALEARLEQLESAVAQAEASHRRPDTAKSAMPRRPRQEIADRLTQLDVDHRAALAARDEADDLGREVAVIAYMSGRTEPDPVLDMLEAGRSGDYLARRTLFGEIRSHARDQNKVFEERAADLATAAQRRPGRSSQPRPPGAAICSAGSRRPIAIGSRRGTTCARWPVSSTASWRWASAIRSPASPPSSVPQRPALAVKIDNAPPARPQTGLSSADIIFEERVEGNITRFVALFHSKEPGVVGPVRSARTSDFDILANLGLPLFANSGANANVLRGIADAPVRDAGSAASGRSLCRRDGSRRAPHNLYVDTDAVWASFDATDPPPFAFEYLLDDEVSNGRRCSGVDHRVRRSRGSFTWDEEKKLWIRGTDGAAHMDAGNDEQVGVTNVVVQFTEYRPSPADIRSPEAITVGGGEAWILSDGEVIQGRWERATPEAPTFFRRSDGRSIRLEPGTTWVALPEPGRASITN